MAMSPRLLRPLARFQAPASRTLYTDNSYNDEVPFYDASRWFADEALTVPAGAPPSAADHCVIFGYVPSASLIEVASLTLRAGFVYPDIGFGYSQTEVRATERVSIQGWFNIWPGIILNAPLVEIVASGGESYWRGTVIANRVDFSGTDVWVVNYGNITAPIVYFLVNSVHIGNVSGNAVFMQSATFNCAGAVTGSVAYEMGAWPRAFGCTDYTALNYDPSATCDDGSCCYFWYTEHDCGNFDCGNNTGPSDGTGYVVITDYDSCGNVLYSSAFDNEAGYPYCCGG